MSQNKSIKNSITKVGLRKIFMPQKRNILISELTVREHFQFFAQMKGSSMAEANEEIKTLVPDVQLENKIDVQARSLSGNYFRKS